MLDPTRDPFLLEHRLKNRPFLPAVAGLEAIVEAAQLASGGPVNELRGVRIVNGLSFPTDRLVAAQVQVTQGADALACRLTTEVRDRQGRVIDPAKLLIEAVAGHAADPIIADAPTRPKLGWYPYEYSDKVLLQHGPPLQKLKDVGYAHGGGWARILAPSPEEQRLTDLYRNKGLEALIQELRKF